jgi:hypothetical protein
VNLQRVLLLIVVTFAVMAVARAQTPTKSDLVGAWTLNADLTDKPAPRAETDDSDRGRDGRGRGFGRRGGGMGPGGIRRGGDPQAAARLREALRDLAVPADHLTIVETASMIIITSSEGRTTRLAPDGSKVREEHTNIERRTKWDAGNLVSEISGLGPGKITQTFAVSPETHQLRVTLVVEGRANEPPRTISQVYDRSS